MNRARLLRELPWGLAILGVVGVSSYLVRWSRDRQVPGGVAPPAGETLTGEAAARLHPKVAPPPVDRARFATLPSDCSCQLGSGARAQLLMHVIGGQQSFSDDGAKTYVVHETAVAIDERVVRLPATDDTAPPGRTEGYATRFDLACDGERLVVVDPSHATLWDLAGTAAKRIWTTALPARRIPVAPPGGQLSIVCAAARIEAGAIVVDEGGPVKIGLEDGKVR